MIEVLCPACKSNQFESLPTGDSLIDMGQHVLCKNCGIIYQNPRPDASELAVYYKENFGKSYTDSDFVQERLACERFDFIQDHIDAGEHLKVREIGCANGYFSKALQDEGFIVDAIEPSNYLAGIARNRGLKVHQGFYEELPIAKAQFDLICAFHVLEHLENPVGTLTRIRKELKSDGRLFLILPTMVDHQLASVFQKIHLTTFVMETALSFLEQNGFRPISARENGYHLEFLLEKAPKNPTIVDYRPIKVRVLDYFANRKRFFDGIKERLTSLEKMNSIAIFGAGQNTIDLHKAFDLSRLPIRAVFDSDETKWGKPFLGTQISPPKAIKDFQGEAILISSFAFQKEIFESLAEVERRKIRRICLFGNTP